MKILITGSNGLLGQKLVYRLKQESGVEILATSKGENRLNDVSGYDYMTCDITSKEQVEAVVSGFLPDCIINCAAMTNVDSCELDPEGCKTMNVDAVSYLINAAKATNAHFIQLSTDFVFDGAAGPYREDAETNPQSTYAKSKLESEQLVKNSGLDWTIIRTIIIYGVTDGEQRSNLVLWVKNSLQQGKQINVITDQFRSPTLAEDLADAVVRAALDRRTGLYHVSGDENDLESIFDLAHRVADYFKLEATLLHPITTKELGQPAPRPPKTGFILEKARKELNYHPRSFDEGLKIVADQLHERAGESL